MPYPQQGFPPEGTPMSQAMQQPGGQMQFVAQPQQQGYVQQPQQQMQYVQTPTGYQQAPQQQPQQQGYPQQQPMQTPLPFPQQGQQHQQPQQGQPQVVQFRGDEILDGPNVPTELRGRTMSQAMALYNTLADSYTNNLYGRQQQRQPQQAPQGAYVQQGQQGYGQQPPNGQPNPNLERQQFMAQPGQFIREQTAQVVNEAIAPLMQGQAITAAEQIRSSLRQSVPDYQALEPEVLRSIQGASPQALANPQFWQNAVRLARGTMMERGQYRPQPNQWQGQQNGQPQSVPAQAWGQQAMQPTHSFFSEAPTPPMGSMQGGWQGQLSPEEDRARVAMGYDIGTWMAWKGGQQR